MVKHLTEGTGGINCAKPSSIAKDKPPLFSQCVFLSSFYVSAGHL